MRGWIGTAFAAVMLSAAASVPANAACQLKLIAELPVKVEHNQPLIEGSVKGQPITMLVDTGSTTNLIWRSAAERLGLPLRNVRGVHFYGVGGESQVQTVSIPELKLASRTFHDVQLFASGDSNVGESIGLLGQGFFSQFDVEFDLAHGVIRLIKPEGCQGSQMVYWSETYSQVPLERSESDHYVIPVELNGRQVEAYLDTGSGLSVASLAAARTAGLTPTSPSVQAAGKSVGLGRAPVQNWIGTFDSIKIGDETISKTKLMFADLFDKTREKEVGSNVSTQIEDMPRVLIGADFFLSHRVLVVPDQRMVYFTYNGGPVFETGLPHRLAAPQSSPK